MVQKQMWCKLWPISIAGMASQEIICQVRFLRLTNLDKNNFSIIATWDGQWASGILSN